MHICFWFSFLLSSCEGRSTEDPVLNVETFRRSFNPKCQNKTAKRQIIEWLCLREKAQMRRAGCPCRRKRAVPKWEEPQQSAEEHGSQKQQVLQDSLNYYSFYESVITHQLLKLCSASVSGLLYVFHTITTNGMSPFKLLFSILVNTVISHTETVP